MKLGSPIDIIKKSVTIFFEKKNMINFVKIYLPLLPFSLFAIWQSMYVKNVDQLKDPKMVGTVALINLAYLIVYLWIWIAGVMAIKLIINNEKFIIKNIYKKAWATVWKFSFLSLVLMLIYFGGLILLLIPALIFGIWYSFSKFIFIDKNVGIKESLSKSKQLINGRFWAILGRYIVFGLAVGLFNILVSALPFGLGGIVTTLFGALFVLPYYLLYLELLKAYKNN